MMPLIIKGENNKNYFKKAEKILKEVKILIDQIIFQMNFLEENNKE